MKIIIILGIDPGIAIVGWGVVEYKGNKFKPLGFGSVQTPASMKTEDRLVEIFNSINEIIKKYKPDCMAVEELFWNTNQTTGIRVSEARGVILLCAARLGIPVYEYTPLQVKQAVVGYGKAEKHQVIAMVTSILKLKKAPKPDDTADAIAIAICHAQSSASAMGKYFNQR